MGVGWRRKNEAVSGILAAGDILGPRVLARPHALRLLSWVCHGLCHEAATAHGRGSARGIMFDRVGCLYLPQLKQKWNVAQGDKGFVVTSNARNEMMMRDAAKFAQQLRKIEAHIKRMQKNAHGAPRLPPSPFESGLPGSRSRVC